LIPKICKEIGEGKFGALYRKEEKQVGYTMMWDILENRMLAGVGILFSKCRVDSYTW
jgi:hypothetical protein